ncbi:MAG TPA: cytochrome c nitrite reductase small subunit [Planctomycetota bacterium]|nr:cytochrome c nitrite reductase small subunit [Planctomycetota bacterium]
MGRRLTSGAALVVALASGSIAGLGGYTFVYARGGSYFTNDPRACANCHVMREHYEGWLKSSHRSVATCNDCHTPASFVGKYWTKASDGFLHSLAFTTDRFPDPIQIRPVNRAITEQACLKCHADLVAGIVGHDDATSCVRCHPSVGHLQSALGTPTASRR